MDAADLREVEARIGYTFREDKYLEAALTHSSYANEHPSKGNERMEFLGDCVLDFLVGERLFFRDRTASEGKLSERRAELVSRKPLAAIVDKLGLLRFLRVSAGLNKNALREKARSDLFEAIIGAVYLDAGIDECRALLDRVFYPNVEPECDYISKLIVYSVEKFKCQPSFDTPQKVGDKFVAKVTVNGKSYAGTGHSMQDAKSEAAKFAYEDLVGGGRR